ncbi:uncharacterized protein LACBIDRAFT_295579 [Laccaria bicolor S238N-H82]|uniref:Predicted protein n=1 Tax=Laccaria bicolor (strain S238N-H82 / ATCC MYA-4686) TaxID=486041 RepID=B0DV95_LACBS|nr:uncharacterized protein LACBIDRAFT_295579 [Laccaria bicolor S238N-H82]EDR01473.1 predicted protein [Laccaria bicolor S238N-H82]|eukprot:XP_001887825.1 predicted protein [Laccaria bicolor S238N-H82]
MPLRCPPLTRYIFQCIASTELEVMNFGDGRNFNSIFGVPGIAVMRKSSHSGHRYVAAHSAACHFLCVTPTHGSNSIFRIPAITLTLPTFLYISNSIFQVPAITLTPLNIYTSLPPTGPYTQSNFILGMIFPSPAITTWQHIVLLVVFLPSLPHHGSNSICQVPVITPMPLNIYTSLPIYLIDFVAAHSAPCRSLCVDPPHVYYPCIPVWFSSRDRKQYYSTNMPFHRGKPSAVLKQVDPDMAILLCIAMYSLKKVELMLQFSLGSTFFRPHGDSHAANLPDIGVRRNMHKQLLVFHPHPVLAVAHIVILFQSGSGRGNMLASKSLDARDPRLRLLSPVDKLYQDGRLLLNFFFTSLFQFSTVWLTRVSLALSIARIFPNGHRARRISAALTIIFILNLITTVTVLNVTCQGGGVPWWKVTAKYCGKGPKKVFVGGVVSIILQILSDIVLTATPLVILWRVNLPSRSKRVIRVAFSGSILMLLLFIACCIVSFDPGLMSKPSAALIPPMISQLEMAVSLIVCNFLVTTTLLYKAWRKRFGRPRPEGQSTEAEDSSDVEESSSRPDDTEHSSPSAAEPKSTQSRTIITFTDVMTDSELYQEISTSTKPESGGSKSG